MDSAAAKFQFSEISIYKFYGKYTNNAFSKGVILIFNSTELQLRVRAALAAYRHATKLKLREP